MPTAHSRVSGEDPEGHVQGVLRYVLEVSLINSVDINRREQVSESNQKQWNVISLGAGVQSSTMALMASRGELLDIQVDFAIFADTQDESKQVYAWLDWLEKQLSFPVYRVTKGRLSDSALAMHRSKAGKEYPLASIPFHVVNEQGKRSIVRFRNCTRDFKINPISKELRLRCGVKRGQKFQTVTSLIGISYDEMTRMKTSRDLWVVNRWPLIELKMRRSDCIEWMVSNGYPEPPKSACVYCPFKSANEFRRMQIDEPDEFARAVQFEKDFNENQAKAGNRNKYFVFRSCKPLDEVDFRSDLEKGQRAFSFLDECDGMCGV